MLMIPARESFYRIQLSPTGTPGTRQFDEKIVAATLVMWSLR